MAATTSTPLCTDPEICSCVLSALGHALPAYTPSLPAPDYSHRPACGETSLQHSPRVGFRQRNPEHTFVKKFPKAMVVLRGQDPDVRMPWYGRDEIASGYLALDDPERVTEISILVDGKLDITMAEGISKVTTVANSSMTLWKRDCPTKRCPEKVEFAFSLPHTYESGHATHPLPPSFQVLDQDGTSLNIRCSYRIRFSVTKAPKSRFAWEKTEHIFLPFDYLPRSRSQEPASVIPGCLDNIKALPNEWYQASRSVSIETHPHLEPVTTNLFVPTARVYPVAEPIPVHIQISGRVDSLRALLSEEDGNCTMSPSSTDKKPDISPASSAINLKKRIANIPGAMVPGVPLRSKSKTQGWDCPDKYRCEPKTLRVYIIRQIRVQLNSKTQLKNLVIAEATLESVPPLMSDCYCAPHDDELEYLSWTGALKCLPEIKTGGFEGEHVKVGDFVALAIGRSEVPWVDVKSSVGIKLVTDSWEDPPEVQIHI